MLENYKQLVVKIVKIDLNFKFEMTSNDHILENLRRRDDSATMLIS